MCYGIRFEHLSIRLIIIGLIILSLFILGFKPPYNAEVQQLKYVILMVGDGMGANHIQAANQYTGAQPDYQKWSQYWVSTYSVDGGYDPKLFWSNFDYALANATDSAAAATALSTGVKTAKGRISVDADGVQRLETIADHARETGRAVGAVTTVYLSHATPGAWYAHNLNRANGYAIADEGLWGDPNTTGDPELPYYGGGFGPSYPFPEVLIGAGHPNWDGGNYLNSTMLTKLRLETSARPNTALVERIAGSTNAGLRLNNDANDPSIYRLVGLFGGAEGNLEYRLADGSGHNPENPTLSEMTEAALRVLSRDIDGFVLMVEGGAIDWASHLNNMDRTLGEQIAFNQAVETVEEWVEDPTNGSSWDNTLVVVTADHETGYLTAGPGAFPDAALGAVDQHSLDLEKDISNSGLTASWEDANHDSIIDPGENVYWTWNTKGHSNSLVPLFVKGFGADHFATKLQGMDPVRGYYIDNTAVHNVINEMMNLQPEPTPVPTEIIGDMHFYLPYLLR